MDETTNRIFVLSQPIQTGKTTLLQLWVEGKSNIGGILTPDVEGKRMLFDIAGKMYTPLQLEDTEAGLKIGRFVFSEDAFARARNILTESLTQNYDWIIVDEIGRLEMDHQQGLEPAISQVIEYFKLAETKTKLLLVIRDYLWEEAKRFYGLSEIALLERTFFVEQQSNNPLNPKSTISNQQSIGVVLCGGQSVRMRRDKAFITYHHKPQYVFVADMMSTICKDVFISCNQQQQSNISQQYPFVLDNATYKNAGPMTGLLSVFEQQKDSAVFVMGCDYPHFTEADMKALFDARENEVDVVCYHNSETHFDEPLLAVYEKQCAALLLDFYKKGNTSLQQFLKTVRTKRITPATMRAIESVDKV